MCNLHLEILTWVPKLLHAVVYLSLYMFFVFLYMVHSEDHNVLFISKLSKF